MILRYKENTFLVKRDELNYRCLDVRMNNYYVTNIKKLVLRGMALFHNINGIECFVLQAYKKLKKHKFELRWTEM